MLASDLTVEVRDISLARQGVIPPGDVNIKLSPVLNGLGSWSLTLPAGHAMASVLETPGAGIIVTGPTDVIMSGPVTSIDKTVSTASPGGTVVFSGVDDSVILSDMLSFPQPSNPDATSQTLAWDVRSGPAESVMRAYVDANCGPSAPAPRRRNGLTLAADQGRGPVVTKSPRFPVLGELLSELALVANLSFRIVQRGSVLVFEVSDRIDRTASVRFDIYNGSLTSQEVVISPPNATTVVVAGQGDLVDRQFIVRTTDQAQADSAAWGRYIEVWVDQRNTDVVTELQQAGDEVLAASGFTQVNTKIVPASALGMEYGKDWNLGDTVVIVVDDVEQQSYISGCNILSNKDGTKIGVVLGDLAALSQTVATQAAADDLASRVSALEKSTSAYTGTGWTIAALNSGYGNSGDLQPLRYRRTTSGQIEIQGAVAGGAGAVFTLPEGYRPDTTLLLSATGGWNGVFCSLFVNTAGVVTLNSTGPDFTFIQQTFGYTVAS